MDSDGSNKYYIGVEREALRCDFNGRLVKTKHPEGFGDFLKNEFFTLDFGEPQVEIRTPICKSTKECYNILEELTSIMLGKLHNKKELIWSYSMPCELPDEKEFPFADYGDNLYEGEYEHYLSKKYGCEMLSISGIHFNFSFDISFYNFLKEKYPQYELPEKLDDAYFKIIKQFINKAWILIYLFGATPMKYNNKDVFLSMRNTKRYGFKNKVDLNVNYDNKQSYINSIEECIKNGSISSAREAYIPIRIKAKDKNTVLTDLSKGPIDHIEIRILDIDPFNICGISKEEMDFLTAFTFYCLVDESDNRYDFEEIAEKGLNDYQLKELLSEIEQIKRINEEFELKCGDGINKILHKCQNNEIISKDVKELIEQKGYLNAIVELAKKYSEEGYNNRLTYKGYPYLELSTIGLIKEALARGINVEVLDEMQSVIRLSKGAHKELAIQATRTNKDFYLLGFMTDNKYIAKMLMQEEGLCVPKGIMLNRHRDDEDMEDIIEKYSKNAVVVKPKTTNCGIGITVFDMPPSKEQLRKAINFAFVYDENVIIEEYIKGKEHRFLVINNKCIAVSWRRNASVVGDGTSTIRELIEKKNVESWHIIDTNIIKIDENLEIDLEKQGLTLESIPEKENRVFLRKVSNCSAGGESVDVTDTIPQKFKDIAERAAKVFDAKICGVDIIIDDLNSDKYAIIEANDNPGVASINVWPYEGKNREEIFTEILKVLELI